MFIQELEKEELGSVPPFWWLCRYMLMPDIDAKCGVPKLFLNMFGNVEPLWKQYKNRLKPSETIGCAIEFTPTQRRHGPHELNSHVMKARAIGLCSRCYFPQKILLWSGASWLAWFVTSISWEDLWILMLYIDVPTCTELGLMGW